MQEMVKLLSELNKLNLPKDKFDIFGSGPISIRGLRKANDLDILVKPELWNELRKKYKISDDKKIIVGDIEIFNNWLPWFNDINKLIDTADVFDGIRFVKLRYVVKWKKAMNREKDKRDIKLIKEYIKNAGIN